ncbi:FkbM family methyltransferase [uncultured Nostoc sp.]|uniref:FkbM family methyltransferase n=1 Tax=uncultured Nostoc sp. TaxID=340711 RepID=UPI0035C9FB64
MSALTSVCLRCLSISNAKIPEYYAFEPALPLLEILRANTKRYGMNAKLFNCGLSDESKAATLTFYPNSSGMSSFYANGEEEKSVLKAIVLNQLQNNLKSWENLIQYSGELLEERFKSQSFSCQLRTLSDVLGEQNVERIDLLKIDAYKSELDVIKGIKNENWKKIKQIVIGVGDKQGRLEQITDLLKIKNYNVVIEKENLYEKSAMYYVYAKRK